MSSDEQLFAICNTSGHIIVGDIETGQIIAKSRGTNKEGNGLMFCCNNRNVLSSDWDGNIFNLDIETGEVATIKIPTIQPNIYVGSSPSQMVIVGYNNIIDKRYLRIWDMSIHDEIKIEEVSIAEEYWDIYIDFSYKINNKIYFYEETTKINCSVYFMDLISKTVKESINVSEWVNAVKKSFDEYVLHTATCLSTDERIILLAFGHIIMAFDIQEKKYIGMLQLKKDKRISVLHFFRNNTKVFIGTWTNAQSVDFPKDFT